MAKRDPLETLRQMRAFALEASELAATGSREVLDDDLGFRRHAERVAELIGDALSQDVEHCNAPHHKPAKLPNAPHTKLYRAALANKVKEASIAPAKSGGKLQPKGNG